MIRPQNVLFDYGGILKIMIKINLFSGKANKQITIIR